MSNKHILSQIIKTFFITIFRILLEAERMILCVFYLFMQHFPTINENYWTIINQILSESLHQQNIQKSFSSRIFKDSILSSVHTKKNFLLNTRNKSFFINRLFLKIPQMIGHKLFIILLCVPKEFEHNWISHFQI